MESVGDHVHISANLMEIVPSTQKDVPYFSKKHVSSLRDLSNKVEVNGRPISCWDLSLLYAINAVDSYRSERKLRVSELFSDEESVRRLALEDFGEMVETKIEEESCGKHIIACARFGNFLHRIASDMILGDQRFFILCSSCHVMSFRVVCKSKKIEEGSVVTRWVVHFFDPKVTNVVSRSEVSNLDELLDSGRFSLEKFMIGRHYKGYFRDAESGSTEDECVVYEYSDEEESSSSFTTLETLSQDGISGCVIYHMMFGGAGPEDIVRLADSSSFSTLSVDVRREIFLAKGSLGISALHMAMEKNKPGSVVSYNNFLGRLSCDEEVNLLPDIIKAESSEGVPALFMAMQGGYVECMAGFGLLLDRLIAVRSRIENFPEVIFNILLAKRVGGLSALSISLLKNKVAAVSAFGGFLDKIFILKEDVTDSAGLFEIIFRLLDHRDGEGCSALFHVLQKGYAAEVRAFGELVDRLLVVKAHVSADYMTSMLFRLLESKSDSDNTALCVALRENHADAVVAFSGLMDRLLVMKGHVPDNDILGMIFRLLESRSDIGNTGLFCALERGAANAVGHFGTLLDKLLVMKGSVPASDIVEMIFKLLESRSDAGNTGLFVALQKDNFLAVSAFMALVDRLLLMKGCVSDDYLARMIFKLLESRSDLGDTGLYVALKEDSVRALSIFRELLDKLLVMKGCVPDSDMARMIFMLLGSKSSSGDTGLSVALRRSDDGISVGIFGELIDRLLVMKGHIPDNEMAGMIFRLLEAKSDAGDTGLFCALKRGNAIALVAFYELLSKSLLMRGHVSDSDMSEMIFRLLEAKSDEHGAGLYYSLEAGNADAVGAFGVLMDCLLAMSGSVPYGSMANMVFRLLEAKSSAGVPGLFVALQNRHIDAVRTFSELVGVLLSMKEHVSGSDLADMLFTLLESRSDVGVPGLFIALQSNSGGTQMVFGNLINKFMLLRGSIPDVTLCSMLLDILMAKSREGVPIIYDLMSHNNSELLGSYGYFLRAFFSASELPPDMVANLLLDLLVSKNDSNGCPALFVAMQEGHDDSIVAYVSLVRRQLMKIRGGVSSDNLVSIVLNIASAKGSDGVSALFAGMRNSRVNAMEAYSALLDEVLSLLKDTIPDDRLVRIIFELLKARTAEGIDGLFLALQEGSSNVISSFCSLLDKLLIMKGSVEDITLFGMVFDLLMCKSGDNNVPGLFVAMQNGHHGAVDAFLELLRRLMVFKDDLSTEYFDSMVLDIVRSRRSDGVSGLSAALESDFPEVVRSYVSLLKLIPKNKLVDVLPAINSSGIPAVLLAGEETFVVYLEMISDLLSARDIYALHSRLSSVRRSVEHILTVDRDLDGKYRLLLDKTKELAISSRQDH
ncbi:ShET2/EspL2 family type III secretion system effector toxin [Candidatus Ichthyocystis sparus]|uniref:ShET2/EspL2 family type III secretion system effector toxin n=1 Tax=Candidatus Ichthyocystis sparus TaxID=1561004 RepID=UPI00159ED4D1|nr:ShET2/EspL2 family type III secretion system effector toxin [Candidatus Ichthyocystis sparus]